MKMADPATKAKEVQPSHTKVCRTPMDWMSRVAIGAVTRAPAPKPATATPAMKPRRSGNHFTRVAMGTR